MDHASPQCQHDAALKPPRTAWQGLADYGTVVKPGIVFGNLITAVGGFFLAACGQVDLALLGATMAGVALIVASACVFNNGIDRDIDRIMVRTRQRALARGAMAPEAAWRYALALAVPGAGLLLFLVNPLALALALFGFAIYVGVYSGCLKRRSVWSTAIGSLAGAMPPVIGYCAVSGRFDATALLLLVMFALWQLPHFHAITLFRRADYEAAQLPLLPVAVTRRHIVGTLVVFIVVSLLPAVIGVAGMAYGVVAFAAGAGWLALALVDGKAADSSAWARRQFFCSIVVVSVLSFMMAVNYV